MENNFSERILPFKNPSITSWTWTAGIFAILENYSNCTGWLYNNFVQLFCEEYDDFVSVHYLPHIDVFSVCPFLHSSLIPRSLLAGLKIDVVNFVKTCVDLGYYVYCFVDEQYISEFVKERFLHELMIYGYGNKEFHIADFTLSNSHKYVCSTMSFENFVKAYDSVEDEEDEMQDGIAGNGGIFIFSIETEAQYDFDLKLFLSYLEDYINCCDRGDIYRTYDLKKPNKFNKDLRSVSYGIEIYDTVQKYYQNVLEGKQYFMRQPLHVIYDHKVLMIKRLYYLKHEKKITISQEIIQEYEKLLGKIKIMRGMGIKYSISKERDILLNIISTMKIIKEEEYFLQMKLISQIKREDEIFKYKE